MTHILNSRDFRMSPGMLEAGKPNHITAYNFDVLFYSQNIQAALPGGKWVTIRPQSKSTGLTIPFLFGTNGSGAITPGDWVEEPLPAPVEEMRPVRGVYKGMFEL